MLAIAGLIAQVLPAAVGLFTGTDSKATKAVEMAVGVAEQLTGKKGDEA